MYLQRLMGRNSSNLCKYVCMKKPTYTILLSLLLPTLQMHAQRPDSIVQQIRIVNELHCDGVSQAEIKTTQYENYERLLKTADTAYLLHLTNDSNGVVNGYAAWALIEKGYEGLAPILIKYLQEDKKIIGFCGCFKMEEPLWYNMYTHYMTQLIAKENIAVRSIDSNASYNKINEQVHNRIIQDKVLQRMDSCILYSDNDMIDYMRGWPLDNRIYPAAYNTRIEYLAFERWSKEAMQYLRKHYGSKYEAQIKHAQIAHLYTAPNKKRAYFADVKELLEYRDEAVNNAVIERLNQDITWQVDRRRFRKLFAQYGLKDRLPRK